MGKLWKNRKFSFLGTKKSLIIDQHYFSKVKKITIYNLKEDKMIFIKPPIFEKRNRFLLNHSN